MTDTRKRKKRKTITFSNKMKKRLIVEGVALAGLFLLVVINMIRIVVKDGTRYEELIYAQQGYTSVPIENKRGDILDKNGTVLATTKKVYNLVLEPKNIIRYESNKDTTVNALKTFFGLTDEEINTYLAQTESYYNVAREDLDYETIKPFLDYCDTDEGAGVLGVKLEEEYKRVYPNGDLACHLLGFYSSGGSTGGVEQTYNAYLSGVNGRIYSYLDQEANMIQEVEASTDGYNVVTSIDANIQEIIQEKVDAYMSETGAENVSVLVMNPDTCDVLALYNSHSYDLNNPGDTSAIRYQFATVENETGDTVALSDADIDAKIASLSDEEMSDALNTVWRNFAVSDVYEPGSTYKPFVVAGALNEGTVTVNDTFVCDGGEQKDTFFIKCVSYDNGGHGTLTLSQTLEKSCNDALMQIAAKEGATTFSKYQDLFGFGQQTGIDIPGEPGVSSLASIIYHEDTLNITELATSSFGQGACVTMMELGTAFCSLINGGYYYQPSVVDRVEDNNGNVIETFDNVLVRKPISEEVSATLRDMLHNVVISGTGAKGAVEGYEIGGKTGTAEKIPRGNDNYLLSFIGFAPIDDPQVMIYVIIDEPHVAAQYSCIDASTLFGTIATDVFPYMNIYKADDVIDQTVANEEITDGSVYEGAIPENDVAGGADNPYVEENGGETTNSTTDDTTEGGTTADDTTAPDTTVDDTTVDTTEPETTE